MRNAFFILFILIAAAASAQSKNERAISRLLEEHTLAWNKGDIETFMKSYWRNDSLLFIGKSGITYGWTNTLNKYKKGYPDKAAMGVLSFDGLLFKKLSRKYYQVLGKWHLKRTIGDISGYYSLLLKKIKGKWVIISDHSS